VVAVLSGRGNLVLAADEVKTADAKVMGKNYCVACTLGKVGANSSCSTVGHKHALKVAAAEDSTGQIIFDLKGKTIDYLYNAKGKEYVDGHHGEEIIVTGKLFIDERVIDIAKVEPKKKDG
jgi:hypothetical protein